MELVIPMVIGALNTVPTNLLNVCQEMVSPSKVYSVDKFFSFQVQGAPQLINFRILLYIQYVSVLSFHDSNIVTLVLLNLWQTIVLDFKKDKGFACMLYYKSSPH